MRDELRACLADLRGKVPDRGLLDAELPDPPAPERPNLTDRARLWDLAIKIGRELGTAVDPSPDVGTPELGIPPRPRRRGKVDFG